MIQLVEGFWCDPWEVKIIKVVNKKSCLLYVTGEGAMDGHVLDFPAKKVVKAVLEAREEAMEYREPEEDTESEPEEENDEDQDEE